MRSRSKIYNIIVISLADFINEDFEVYRVAKQKAEKTKVEMVYRNLPQTEQWNLVQHRGAPKGPREVWRANHRPSQLRRWLFI